MGAAATSSEAVAKHTMPLERDTKDVLKNGHSNATPKMY
jgi:hypothetical protein